MTMSKHETALALIDEQIEKTEREKVQSETQVTMAQSALARAEKELKLINWSLTELYSSRSALVTDRQVHADLEAPAEL